MMLMIIRCIAMSFKSGRWAAARAPSHQIVPYSGHLPSLILLIALCTAPTFGSDVRGTGDCQTDFWVVSTRNVERPTLWSGWKVGGRWAAPTTDGGGFTVYHFDGTGGCELSNFDSLHSARDPGVPICVMSHGSFVDWNTMCRDSAATNQWLRSARPGAPLQVVFFTWPSDETLFVSFTRNVADLGQRASRHGVYMAQLVASFPPESQVCLIGHSHGARVVISALHQLAGGEVDGQAAAPAMVTGRRIRAVLAAAAVDHSWLNPGEKYGMALCQAEAVVNLANCRDPALVFYPLRKPLSPYALATVGFTRKDRRQFGDQNAKVHEIDVSRVVGMHHTWPHYYAQPAISQCIAGYVFDATPSYLPLPADSPDMHGLENVPPSPPETAEFDLPPISFAADSELSPHVDLPAPAPPNNIWVERRRR